MGSGVDTSSIAETGVAEARVAEGKVSGISLGLSLALPDAVVAGDGDVGGVDAGSALAVNGGEGVAKTGVTGVAEARVAVGKVGGVSLSGDSSNNGSNNSLKRTQLAFCKQLMPEENTISFGEHY